MSRISHAAEQVVVELARTKLLDVQEHGQTAQLQVNFQQTVRTDTRLTQANSVQRMKNLSKE